MDSKIMPAGKFKQLCLAVLDSVAQSHHEVIITKRGKPVAKLVPLETAEEREQSIIKGLQGKARMLVDESDFLKPTIDEGGWPDWVKSS